MALTKEGAASVIQEHQRHGNDTGSAEVQIALLTNRISHLTEHFIVISLKKRLGMRSLNEHHYAYFVKLTVTHFFDFT